MGLEVESLLLQMIATLLLRHPLAHPYLNRQPLWAPVLPVHKGELLLVAPLCWSQELALPFGRVVVSFCVPNRSLWP